MQQWRGNSNDPGGRSDRTFKIKVVLVAALLSLVSIQFRDLPTRFGTLGQYPDVRASPAYGEATGTSPPVEKVSRSFKIETLQPQRKPSKTDDATVRPHSAIAAGSPPLIPQPSDKPQPSEERAKHILLLGERHSGTNWITNHLSDCFGEDLKVGLPRPRFKHWFQDSDLGLGLAENPAVVVTMFRDPYDWVEAMRIEPHHAQDHINWSTNNIDYDKGWHTQGGTPMPWRQFVTKPWTGKRGPADEALLKTQEGIQNASCMAGYSFGEVVPCSPADSLRVVGLAGLMYELRHDKSERAYSSVVDLRRDKILNHLSVADFPREMVTRFLPFRFEDLVANGTASLLRTVEDATGVTAKCNATRGRTLRHRKMPEDYVSWMGRFVDWEVERRIGYFPKLIEHAPARETPNGRPLTHARNKNQESVIHQVRGRLSKKQVGEEVIAKLTKQKDDPTTLTKRIVLLGERHSGTNWITNHLSDCFQGDATVTNENPRYKHWFQEEDPTKVQKNSSVVVAMFRDPYDWVEAMRVEPHHAHDHIHWPAGEINYDKGWRAQGGTPLTWKEFVTKPWEGKRDSAVEAIIQNPEVFNTTRCLEGYDFSEIIPCSTSGALFLKGLGDCKYELQHDGSARAYSSIIELRRDKILSKFLASFFAKGILL